MKYTYISVEEIQEPVDGAETIVDHWWIVTPENNVIIWTGRSTAYTPQCNADKRIVEWSLKRFGYENCTVQKIPVAFLKIPSKVLQERMKFELSY